MDQIVTLRSANTQKRGAVGTAVERGKQEIKTRLETAKAFLHNEHKRQVVRDAALGLLPYKPARVAGGSHFDAVLTVPQDFGTESVPVPQVLRLGQTTPVQGRTSANTVAGGYS